MKNLNITGMGEKIESYIVDQLRLNEIGNPADERIENIADNVLQKYRSEFENVYSNDEQGYIDLQTDISVFVRLI